MYLVVLWTTMVAPSFSGFWRQGEAKVLSTVRVRPWPFRDLGYLPDVEDEHQGVGRGLHPDHLRVGLDRPLEVARVRGVDPVEGDPEVPEDLVEEPERPAVDVVAYDHVVSAAKEPGDGSLAASPEAKARPNLPPSRSATALSSLCLVGFPLREYS